MSFHSAVDRVFKNPSIRLWSRHESSLILKTVERKEKTIHRFEAFAYFCLSVGWAMDTFWKYWVLCYFKI